MSTATLETSSAAIWERVVNPENDELTPEEARAVLRWKFTEKDLRRADKLSAKARAGTLNPSEADELDRYLSIESALISLKSRARLCLKRVGTPA